jgi:large subunit ribosomal protein L21
MDVYAIIETGGKQYRVSPGERLKVEKLQASPGQEVVFDRVLAVGTEDGPVFGNPYLAQATVSAQVLSTGKARKVLVFKQKPRKGYRRLKGHRQPYTEVLIKEIKAGGS